MSDLWEAKYYFWVCECFLNGFGDLSICTIGDSRMVGLPILFMCACVKFVICRSSQFYNTNCWGEDATFHIKLSQKPSVVQVESSLLFVLYLKFAHLRKVFCNSVKEGVMLLSDLLATQPFAALMVIFVQLVKIRTLPMNSIPLFWFHVVRVCLLATCWRAAACRIPQRSLKHSIE